MSANPDDKAICLPAPARSTLRSAIVLFGGFLMLLLGLMVASQLELPWVEHSSVADNLLGLGLIGLWVIPLGISTWHILDRSPLLAINAKGMRLHPRFGVPPLGWHQVRGADLTVEHIGSGQRTVLTIFLARSFRGWLRPLGGNRVMLDALSNSEDAQKLAEICERINVESVG